jgi:hypothetical protein
MAKNGSTGGGWKDFWGFGFWRKIQRRGAHVNPPKIGSRAA